MSKFSLHKRYETTGLRDYGTALRQAQGPCLEVSKSRVSKSKDIVV